MKYSLILVTILLIIITNPKLAGSDPQSHIEWLEVSPNMIVPEGETYRKEQNLKEWMQKLAQKESSGSCTISIIDTNNKRSTGKYQYQDATWLSKGKQYNIPTTLENITDCHLQDELTYRILSNEPTGWRNWQCSVIGCEKWDIVGIGLPPTV